MEALEALRQVARDPVPLATEARENGKKVLGYRCVYVPEEILDAAGIMPYPLMGTQETVSLADSYLQPNICEFIRNIFDQALKGHLDFLDGLVLCNTCDAVRKLYDHWKAYIHTPFCYLINNPQMQFTDLAYHYQHQEMKLLHKALEDFTSTTITNQALADSIRLHNRTRALLREAYAFRKQDPPRLSGEEALEMVMGTMYLPKERANLLLEQLISELKARPQPPLPPGPRVMVTGSVIDHPTLIALVEESGGIVVADDLCSTTRYFWHPINETPEPLDGDDGPLAALARHTIEKPVCACMHPPEARLSYMLELVREYHPDGIIYFNLKYCDPFLYEGVLFKKELESRDMPDPDLRRGRTDCWGNLCPELSVGDLRCRYPKDCDPFLSEGISLNPGVGRRSIPTMLLEVEHTPSGAGQLKTRIQAFLEML